MVDTVNFKITQVEAKGGNFIDEITPFLDTDSLAFHEYGNNTVVTGNIDNLKISISPFQVKVKDGSLCKWMLGDNYQAMGRGDIKRAIERLSDTLHLPMTRAIITRLDVGLTIPVKEPTANYFNHLGVLRYAQRLQQPNSLYYHRHSQAERLCFYDKNKEQRERRDEIPDIFKDCNVLRYEQRYMKRLPTLLKVEQVTGALLYDETFYIELLNRWRDTFKEINKTHELTLNIKEMRTKKDLNRMGIIALAERVGGELEMISQINEAQKRGDLTAKQALDLRKAIKDACKSGKGLTVPNEAMAELEKKIVDAVRYYR